MRLLCAVLVGFLVSQCWGIDIIVDDANPDIKYTPRSAWTSYINDYDRPDLNNHTVTVGYVPDSSFTYHFQGSSIQWFGRTAVYVHASVFVSEADHSPRSGFGLCSISVDDAQVVVDKSSPTFAITKWESSPLDPTKQHTFSLKVLPPRAGDILQSAGCDIDYFKILDAVVQTSTPPPTGSATDTSAPAATGSQSTTTSQQGPAQTSAEIPATTGSNVAVIAGAVGGTALALLVAAVVGCVIWRRRRTHRVSVEAAEVDSADVVSSWAPNAPLAVPVTFPSQSSFRVNEKGRTIPTTSTRTSVPTTTTSATDAESHTPYGFSDAASSSASASGSGARTRSRNAAFSVISEAPEVVDVPPVYNDRWHGSGSEGQSSEVR